MRAIFIDSVNREVKEVDLDPNSNILEQWYDILKVDMVEVGCYLSEKDSIMVDEEGLLKNTKEFFIYNGAHQPFAGNGLIVGVDSEGETISCEISLEEVERNTRFYTREEIIEKNLYDTK